MHDLHQLSPIVTPITAMQKDSEESSFFGLFPKNNRETTGKISMYLNYYNHSLWDWIQLMKERGGIIPEEDIQYILVNFLRLAVRFN